MHTGLDGFFTMFCKMVIMSSIWVFITNCSPSSQAMWSSLSVRIANFVPVIPIPLAKHRPGLWWPNSFVRESSPLLVVVPDSSVSFSISCNFSYNKYRIWKDEHSSCNFKFLSFMRVQKRYQLQKRVKEMLAAQVTVKSCRTFCLWDVDRNFDNSLLWTKKKKKCK